MQEILKKVFKGNYVPQDMQDYITGKTNLYDNTDNYFYSWEELIESMNKNIGFDNIYMLRTLKLLFEHDRAYCHRTYFKLFKKDDEEYKKAVDFIINEIGLTLSEAVFLFLKTEKKLKNFDAFFNYFYQKDPVEFENIILQYKNFGAAVSYSSNIDYNYTYNIEAYLNFMKTHSSNEFEKKLNSLKTTPYTAFSAFMSYYDDENKRLNYLTGKLKYFLKNSVKAQNDTIDAIIKYIETGEEGKNFEKLIKKISTQKKSYVSWDQDLTEFLKYRKPNPKDKYCQRIITIFFKIDKYRTIKRLILNIHSKKDKRKVIKKENFDELIKKWETIEYKDIIDTLIYFYSINLYRIPSEKFIRRYINEDIDKFLTALKTSNPKGIFSVITNFIVKQNKNKAIEFILENIELAKGKTVIKNTVSLISDNKYRDKLKELTKSKKSNVREIAIKSLIKLGKEDKEFFESLRKKEKSQKIIEILNEILGSNFENNIQENYYSKEEILKRAKTKKYRNHTDYSKYPKFVWQEDNTELPLFFTEYLFSILKSKDKTLVANKEAKEILSRLTSKSIDNFLNSLEDYLIMSDEAIKIMPFCKNEKYIDILSRYIQELIYGYRGATAAKVVKAIASFKTTKAIRILDFLTIKKNANDARVNRAALEAMDEIAREMNLTKEDLLDYIVPNFGFDKTGKLILDFGPRQFTITLQNDLSMKIIDNKGKTFKNLPKTGKNDDPEKSKQAIELFKKIKKELKKQVKFERERLERGFSGNRIWKGENWLKLFVNNPIMRQFALNLVWGKYTEKGKLLTSFRYFEDGTFSDINEDEIQIENSDLIGLVHPVEFTPEELSIWKEIIEDYEIEQPFNQINRPVFKLKSENKDKTFIDDFKGYMLHRFTLKNTLLKYGWLRGEVEDAGIYYYYYKTYPENITARLEFLGDYVGNYDDNKEIPIYDVYMAKSGKSISLGYLPARLYSELYYELKKITDRGSGFNKDWEKIDW